MQVFRNDVTQDMGKHAGMRRVEEWGLCYDGQLLCVSVEDDGFGGISRSTSQSFWEEGYASWDLRTSTLDLLGQIVADCSLLKSDARPLFSLLLSAVQQEIDWDSVDVVPEPCPWF